MNKVFLVALFAVAAMADVAADEKSYCPTDKALCVDKNDSCAAWADAGECPKNPAWMLPWCAKSCCSVCVVEVVVVDPAVCPTEAKDCVAQTNDHCQKWADVDDEGATQCEDNAIWMTPNCMQSCCDVCHHDDNKCPTVKPTLGCKNVPQGEAAAVIDACVDGEWKEQCKECADVESDECKASSTSEDIFTVVYCSTYKECAANHAAVATTDATCAAWSKLGECTKNPVWMNVNCQKECCHTCHDKPAVVAPVIRYQQPFYGGYQQPRYVQQPVAQVQQPRYVQPSFGGYNNGINNIAQPAFGGYGNGFPYAGR